SRQEQREQDRQSGDAAQRDEKRPALLANAVSKIAIVVSHQKGRAAGNRRGRREDWGQFRCLSYFGSDLAPLAGFHNLRPSLRSVNRRLDKIFGRLLADQ